MSNQIKNFLKLILILVVVFFSIIGVLASIAIYNYQFKNVRGTDFNSRFTYILSEKAALDGWQEYENYFKSNFDKNREMGEFRKRFISNELLERKLKIYNDEKSIKGIVFQDGQRYKSEINLDTLEISISEQPAIWHWHWYNWLGIGIDKVHKQTVDEMINTPLPVKKQK